MAALQKRNKLFSLSYNFKCFLFSDKIWGSKEEPLENQRWTSIPTPEEFQSRQWTNRKLTSITKVILGLYEGDLDEKERMNGSGKLFTEDKKQYIRGKWLHNKLTEVESCQFVIEDRCRITVYIRKQPTNYLLIIDENDYVARININISTSLDLGNSFVNARKVILAKINVIKILEDLFADEVEIHFQEMKNLVQDIMYNTASSINCAEDFYQMKKIFNKNKNMKEIFSQISSSKYISTNLKIIVRKLLEKEKKLSLKYSSIPFRNECKFEDICHELNNNCKQVVINHRNALRKSCPSFDSELYYMAEDIDKIEQDLVLFVSCKDLSMFMNLTVLNEGLNHKLKEDITSHIKQLWNEFSRNISYIPNNKSIIEMGPLINQVYLQLYHNFMELTKNCNSKIFKFDSLGKIIVGDKTEDYNGNEFETIQFMCKLLNYFHPGSYFLSQEKFHYDFKILKPNNETLASPENKLIWLYILDNSLSTFVNKENYETVAEFFSELINCFINLVQKSKGERYESFRVSTNNIIIFITSVSPYFLNNDYYETIDNNILKLQIAMIDKVIQSDEDNLSSDVFSSLINVYNDYWDNRENIIRKIPAKFSYDPFQKTLHYISGKLLQIVEQIFKMEQGVQMIVTCCRSYNEFLKFLNGVDFTWIIKKSSIDTATTCVELLNKDKDTYKVIDIESYIEKRGMSNVPKHYVIEIINILLDVIITFSNKINEYNRIKGLNDLLLAIGRYFIYFKEQKSYTDFDQFLADSTKPFISITESSDYFDFKKRVENIENFFVYTRRQSEINIDKALTLYSSEAHKISNDFDGTFDSVILKKCYDKYLEEFERNIQISEDNILGDLKNDLDKQEDIEIHNVSKDFKQDVIPVILGKVSAVWSKQESKDLESTGKVLKPHCIQVICILRLLSVDKTEAGIDCHLAQVLTGQGKSIVLGLLSTLLALLKFNVRVVCYSDYLAKRDQNDFNKFFDIYKSFGVPKRITYGTFENMANEILQFEMNGRKENLRSLVTKLVQNKLKNQTSNIEINQTERNILLIDEVDVFFSEEYYGNTYNPCETIIMSALGDIQLKIWEYVSNGMRNKDEIFERIKEFTNTIVREKKDVEFNKLITLSKYFVIEELKKMIQDALIVIEEKDYKKDRYKINDEGKLCIIKNNSIYSTSTYIRYKNAFYYIKLKKNNLETKNEDYSYLLIRCGNISYAMLPNEYHLILGVSGTLTTLNTAERQGVQSYNIKKLSTMPTFFGLNKLVFDKLNDFIIADTEENWLSKINMHINKKIESKRSVIIIFNSENEMNRFKNKYEDNIDRLHILTGNEEQSKLEWYVSEAGISRTVTLATKNMGRGVDYKSNDSTVEENGGVHVIQTFFSLDEKEETQIKGRTARKDNKGSYEMIICIKHLGDTFKNKNKYEDFYDTRKQEEEKNKNRINERIIKSAEKHKKTMKFLKSFSTYTIEKRSKYLSEYPIVEEE